MYRKKLNKFKIIIIFGGSSRSARLHGQKRKRTKTKKFHLLFHYTLPSQSPELHIAKAERPEASLQHVFVSVHKRRVSQCVCMSTLLSEKSCREKKNMWRKEIFACEKFQWNRPKKKWEDIEFVECGVMNGIKYEISAKKYIHDHHRSIISLTLSLSTNTRMC